MKIINEITPEILKTFDEIDRNCLKMHVAPPARAFYQLEVFDADGVKTMDYKFKSNSWVRNYYNMLLSTAFLVNSSAESAVATFGEGYLAYKEQDGTVRAQTYAYQTRLNDRFAIGGAGDANKGIIVGSGTTAESLDSYALATKINNGTGTGQLSYLAGAAHNKAYNSDTKKWSDTLVRYFNNNSGAAINVNEVGLMTTSYNESQFNTLQARDVLGTTVSVPNGGQLKVTYVLEMTFPG